MNELIHYYYYRTYFFLYFLNWVLRFFFYGAAQLVLGIQTYTLHRFCILDKVIINLNTKI
jgi:hypothetical protein